MMPALPLPSVPPRANILLDANVLVYAAGRASPECMDFLDRCRREEISGYTTAEVINEVCHRLMAAEAFAAGVITRPNAASLRAKRDMVRGLRTYWLQTEALLRSNILVLELDELRIRRAQALRETHGLLATD